jgi:hypothetical protein
MVMSQPICTCISHGCADKEARDERGHLHRGKWLGVQEYWDHCRQDRCLEYLALDTSPDAASPFPIPQYTECHDLVVPSLAGDTHDDINDMMAWTSSQEDELVTNLESCLSVFRSGLLKEHQIDSLVSCQLSKEDDLHTPPPLQSLAPANTKWIIKLCLETKKLDCGSFKQCKSIRDHLLKDLRNKWTKLKELKCRAWQMASYHGLQFQLAVPPHPDPGLAVIIDTCEYFSQLNQDLYGLNFIFFSSLSFYHPIPFSQHSRHPTHHFGGIHSHCHNAHCIWTITDRL